MSDELLLRRLRIGWHDDDTPIWVSDTMVEAAYRIEALTAERDKYESAWMTAEGKLADAEALIESQAKDHASNNIRFAEAEHRAKTAEAERAHAWEMAAKADTQMGQSLADHLQAKAERDRLRALLAEADRRIAWEAHGFGNDFAERVEAALKGESHD